MDIKPEPLAIDSEIVAMLYASNKRSLIAACIVAAALLIIQHVHISANRMLLWSLAFALIYSVRTLVTIWHYKSLTKEQHVQRWLILFRICTGLCGLTWGLAGVLLFPAANAEHQTFLLFALVGVAGAAIVIYSIDALCSNLFIGGLLVLMIPRYLVNGSHLSIALAILFVVYVTYVTLAGRTLARSLRENMTLRIASNLDNQKVYRLAYYDVLTGLPNRRLLADRMHQTFLRCQRSLSYGAILFLDLNNFKGLNDSKGHIAGDTLLQLVAERLQNTLREKDTVARVGGDEFVVVLDDLGNDKEIAVNAGKLAAEKLLSAFEEPFQLTNFKYHTSPSIGICVFLGKELEETEALRRADVAMYIAKHSERVVRVQVYDNEINPAIELRATLENDLAFALNDNQFLLYYQLQVDQFQRPIGAEVLLRWNHPTLGFIPPNEFIPIAEESSAIVAIGSWVLMQACLQLKMWEKSVATSALRLSVNVSALQFSQPDFVDQVIHAINVADCNPRLLRLELTESLVVKNIQDVINKMNVLKRIGITFSLDDFGIGQSSLSVLRKIPLDELKIDRSFINDILVNNFDAIIARTIVNMGRNLSLTVIAEGVELSEQKKLLLKFGCRAFQGFLFSKPLPLADFEAKLSTKLESIP